MRNFSLIVSLIFILNQNTSVSFGQLKEYDFTNYSQLKSSGKLPKDFLCSRKKYYTSHLDEFANLEDKKEREEKESYTSIMSKNIYDMLFSGRIIFNDPVSNYIDKVFGKLKENNPGKFDNVRIYLLKSASVNASATDHKIIFINMGLMAYIQNEAQLAFILCHELSHIVNKDNMESFIEKKRILDGKGIYGSTSFDEKIDIFFLHNKSVELSADSNALEFYMNCNYDTSEIFNAFDILHYSYMPFANDSFPINYFNSNGFEIPEVFFKSTINPISSIENYKDKYHTHPNIFKRKEKTHQLLKDKKYNGKDLFKINKEEFYTVRNIARFETVRLQILNKNYTEAIYSAFTLLNEFPDNKYLKASIAKALYGLAKYRNTDEYHLVTKSYSNVEGHSQQLHYLFKQMKKVQLNVLALKYVHDLTHKYTDDQTLKNLREDLVFDLIYFHGDDLSKFNDKPVKYTVIDKYNKGEEDNQKTAMMQKEVADFYLNAFCDEKQDIEFQSVFDKNSELSKKRKNEEDLPYNEREKIKETREKEITKNGISCKGGKFVILDPFYIEFDEIDEIDFVKEEAEKIEIDEFIKAKIEKAELPGIFLSSADFSENNVDEYNYWSIYKELIEELLTKKTTELLPLSNNFQKISKQQNANIVCVTGNYKIKSSVYYIIHFYDLETGKLVYKNQSLNSLKSNLSRDLLLIKN